MIVAPTDGLLAGPPLSAYILSELTAGLQRRHAAAEAPTALGQRGCAVEIIW